MEKRKDRFFEKIKIHFTSEKKYAFFSVIIIGFLAHFNLFSQLITTTDGFTFGSRYYAGEWEISLGRWFIVILNKFRYGLVTPTYITFFSLFILGISSVLIVDIFEIKKRLTSIMISACIILAPFVYQTLLYTYTADAYFIAWLLSVLAVFLYKRKVKIGSVICIILLMATYQSYISVVMSLGLSLIIFNLSRNTIDEAVKEFFVYYIICFLGILLYYIVTLIILKITGIELASYKGANVNGILNIIRNLPNGMLNSYLSTYSYFFYDNIINNSEYSRQLFFAIMYLFLIIHIIFIKDKMKIVTMLCFVVVSPMMLCFTEILIVNQYTNILMSAALICPILLFIKLIDEQENLKIQYLEVIVVFFILYSYAIMGEATYMSLQKNYEQVHSKLIRVIDRIESHEEYKEGMEVAFIGNFEYFNELDVYELSNGDFSNLGVFREVQNASLAGLLKERFGENFHVYDSYLNIEVDNMKAFPNKDCIKVINNIMVVKLD